MARGARGVRPARLGPDRRARRAEPLAEARLLAADLGACGPPAVLAGAGGRGPGTSSCALGSRDRRLGREGYRLEVGASAAHRGAHGGRRLLRHAQRRCSSCAGSASIPAGTARDWPRYPERGLMIDNGRRYFSPGWLRREIRELAYLKLNQLHLHFSDDQGFRIESRSHPEIVSGPHLTKRQVRGIVALARRAPHPGDPGDRHARPHGRGAGASPGLQLAGASGARAPTSST